MPTGSPTLLPRREKPSEPPSKRDLQQKSARGCPTGSWKGLVQDPVVQKELALDAEQTKRFVQMAKDRPEPKEPGRLRPFPKEKASPKSAAAAESSLNEGFTAAQKQRFQMLPLQVQQQLLTAGSAVTGQAPQSILALFR